MAAGSRWIPSPTPADLYLRQANVESLQMRPGENHESKSKKSIQSKSHGSLPKAVDTGSSGRQTAVSSLRKHRGRLREFHNNARSRRSSNASPTERLETQPSSTVQNRTSHWTADQKCNRRKGKAHSHPCPNDTQAGR
jgi:hypothetical protein